MFKALDKQNKSFLFRHCWLKLRNQPKWHEKLQQLAVVKASNKKQKITKDSSPRTAQPINVDSSPQDSSVAPPKTIPPATEAPKRPFGKKKAKEA